MPEGLQNITESAALGVVGGAVGGAVSGEISSWFAGGATVGGIHASLHGNNILTGVVQGGLEGAKYGGAMGMTKSLKTNTNILNGTNKNYKTSLTTFPPEGSFVSENETTDIASPYPSMYRMGPEELAI